MALLAKRMARLERRTAPAGRQPDQERDLCHLLRGADCVSGMAADLTLCHPGKDRDGYRCKKYGKNRLRAKKNQQPEQCRESEDTADDKRLFVRLPGGRRKSVVPRWRQCEPVPESQRSGYNCRSKQGNDAVARGDNCGKCGYPQDQIEDKRNRAIGSNPAVVHDVQLSLLRTAATESVEGVGESVLVQATGDQGR